MILGLLWHTKWCVYCLRYCIRSRKTSQRWTPMLCTFRLMLYIKPDQIWLCALQNKYIAALRCVLVSSFTWLVLELTRKHHPTQREWRCHRWRIWVYVLCDIFLNMSDVFNISSTGADCTFSCHVRDVKNLNLHFYTHTVFVHKCTCTHKASVFFWRQETLGCALTLFTSFSLTHTDTHT